MEPTAARPDRTLIAILSVIAAIVVIALVVVFTRGGPAVLDPATPEGVVQSYSLAIVDSDFATARDLLSAELRENCDPADPSTFQGLRMTVISSTINDDTAVVRVSMERGSGDFGGSGYVSEEVFTLVLEDRSWRIESAPWDLTLCYNQGLGE
ncbi:hypothetical protein I6E68_05535 [Salinibacterium sp. NSLL150]|nr:MULTISPECIES: hypothetical protein [unclassified Salinibacterium]MBH0023643.1 hypothetical protein [Salinibacterium sp. SWN248]MBH0098603.1 hypothetical protein [Salinibacterium sp. NSLL35]MBH0101358.1 hypothetical protein [Salinibacterium sp. NSLL150]MBH0104117.1 hypothetical protein [Salinibacterium sp. NSLL16]MBH0106878.1 hypothetical protein [Salinibacterium sp. NSLL17]